MAGEGSTSTRGTASGIYGLVVAGATLATSASLNDLSDIAVAVIVTVFVYWAAESYSHILAARLVNGRALTRSEALAVARQGWPLVSASYLPLVAFVVAGVISDNVTTAVLFGLVVTTVLLAAAGLTAGRRSGVVGWRLLLTACISAAFGLVMIVLKLQLH